MAVIKRIGSLSLGKIYGSILAVVGLAQGIGYAATYAIDPASAPFYFNMGFEMGYWAILLVPAISAVSGFVSGVVFAWLYNLFLKQWGGVKLDMEVAVPNTSTTTTFVKRKK